MAHVRTRLLAVAAVALAATAVAVSTAESAQAAPIYPSGAHITGVSHSAVRVGMNAVADRDLTSYRVVVSTDKAKLTVAYLNAHSFRSTYYNHASTNSVLVSGMAFTTAPYYYRVGITYGRYPNYVAWGSTYSAGFGLAPNAPTALRTVHGAAGTYLQWTAPSGGSTGTAIDQTNTTTGTTGTYTIHNTTPKFTPYGLGAATYTYRVRAINIATHSTSSTTTSSITGPLDETKIRVMSYNTLGANLKSVTGPDGKPLTYAGWAARVTPAAELVQKYLPDVLTVQEGDAILGADGTAHPGNHAYPTTTWPGDWWSIQKATTKTTTCNTYYDKASPAFSGDKYYRNYFAYRAVDSLCDYTNHAIGRTVYARATDATPLHNGSGNYLIYNATTMTQLTAADLRVGTAACYGSDDPADTPPPSLTTAQAKCGGFSVLEKDSVEERTAAWAAFSVKSSGTRILVVSPHTSAALGAGWDARRTQQVTQMVRFAQAKATALGITKIVYAGDFNNYPGRPGLTDSTTAVMKAAGYPDSIENAQHRYNTSYLSGNFYTSPPKRTPDLQPGFANLDHIYIYPGIGVQTFGEGLTLLSNGKFPGVIPSDHNPVYADLFLQG